MHFSIYSKNKAQFNSGHVRILGLPNLAGSGSGPCPKFSNIKGLNLNMGIYI